MCLGYKLRFFTSTKTLCSDIQKSADELSEGLNGVEDLLPRLNTRFDEVKKLIPEMGKLSVQVASLKEYHPKLQDTMFEKKQKMHDLEQFIAQDVANFSKKFDIALASVKKIAVDSSALFYKENNLLNRYAKKIRQIRGDETLANHLLVRINEVKEDMKSTARQMFESASAEEHNVFDLENTKRQGISLAEQIHRLGIVIDEVAKVIEKLNIDDIEDIVKASEEELKSIKKMQLEAIIVLAKLGRYMSTVRSKMNFLGDHNRDKMLKVLSSSERKIASIKKTITKNNQDLFNEIRIFETVASKF